MISSTEQLAGQPEACQVSVEVASQIARPLLIELKDPGLSSTL